MNTKYHIDSERKVTVVTETGQIIDKGEYTKNTDEILSLENYAESTQNKINIFEKRINEINNKIRKRNKNVRKIDLILMIISLILLVFSAITYTNIILLTTLISSTLPLITIFIEKIITKKDNDQKDYCSERLKEEEIKFNKIKEKIDILSKDKTPDEFIKINTFIEVKPINRQELDSEDYFISKYKLEKRVREMTAEIPKTKKLTKQKINNTMYDI